MRFGSNSLVIVGAPNLLVAKGSSDYPLAEGLPKIFLRHCMQPLRISSKDLILKKIVIMPNGICKLKVQIRHLFLHTGVLPLS